MSLFGWSRASQRRGADYPLGARSSLEGPGLAVFDSKLYCIHRAATATATRNCGGAPTAAAAPGAPTSSSPPTPAGPTEPAVIAYRDQHGSKNQLLVIHHGYGNRSAGTDTAEVEARIAAEESWRGRRNNHTLSCEVNLSMA